MAKTKGMTEDRLAAMAWSEITNAIGYGDETETSLRRGKALDYVNGDPSIIGHEAGYSSVVSTDVADVIGWILPGLMRVFASSDNLAEFEPEGPEDEETAKQATDYINYVFWRDCEGYRVLHEAIYEGLLFGNGIIKHWWDNSVEYECLTYRGLSDESYTYLLDDDDVEVKEHTETVEMDVQADPMTGTGIQVPVVTHDVKISRKRTKGRLRIMCLPPEEFLINKDATDLPSADFVAHRRESTRADLIAEGFDREKVMAMGADEELETSDEYIARWQETVTPADRDSTDKMMEKVEVFECYMRCDYDGDDWAEWRRVVMGAAGGQKQVLLNEEWDDDVPFSDLVPDPRPHRWEGNSVFDDMRQIQDIKTVLMRQTLDNLYLVNSPLRYVQENQIVNMDAVMTPQIGGVVIGKGPANQAIADLPVPFVAEQSFGMLEYLDMVAEKRTGVSRQSMALDPEALQNQTATGVQEAQAASYAKVELYARNIAELGLKRLMKCVYKTIVRNQDEERQLRFKGDWMTFDPRVWNADMDVSINVGLGTGSKDRDIAGLSNILAKMEQILLQLGPSNPLVDLSQYGDALKKLVEATGIKNPDAYFKDVTPEAMQQMMQAMQGGPDPKMVEAQQKAQLDQMKAQADIQLQQQKTAAQLQADREKAAMDMELQRERSAAEIQMQREKNAADIELMREKAGQEMTLRRDEMMIEAELTRQANTQKAQAQADTNVDRP